MQLARDLDIPQKTAWYILHRIRQTLTDKAPLMTEGVIETDESVIMGRIETVTITRRLKAH